MTSNIRESPPIFFFPGADGSPGTDADDDRDPVEDNETEFVVMDRPCPLCKRGSDHAYHYFFECSAAELQVARQHLQGGFTAAILSILRAVDVHGTRRPVTEAGRAALRGLDCNSPEGRAVAHRLLCGLPFPARVADPVSAPTARLVGELFDALGVDSSKVRGMASSVVNWAAKHTRRVADARRAAVTDTWPLNDRKHTAPKETGRYPDGGVATTTSIPHDVIIRWRHPARNAECTNCGEGTSIATDVPCLRCPRSRHRQGHPRCDALLVVPHGSEWACPSCAEEIDALTGQLGLPPMQPATTAQRPVAHAWQNPTPLREPRFTTWQPASDPERWMAPPRATAQWPVWPNVEAERQPPSRLERWMAPPRTTVYWPLWPDAASRRQPPSSQAPSGNQPPAAGQPYWLAPGTPPGQPRHSSARRPPGQR